MSGMIFLFMAWGAWITATFILDKKKTFRLPVAMGSLMLIILHSKSITIYSIQIGAASFLLIFSAYLLVYQGTWLKKIYLFFSVMIIMLGYIGFYLLELYDPVWVLVDRKILLSVGLLLIGWMLYPVSFVYRYAAIVIGSLQGEVFLSVFFSKWKMPYPIGSNDYLDVLALTISALLTVYAARRLLFGVKRAVKDGFKEKKQMVH
ncbi:hypothetical protein J6TS1_23910 [Siminovitchia terrae]|uniref:Uncharacterized protein n=3 Tax=Siminovitchia terrae TaxID=1914933 RepID=A0A429X494_SIMTE|nr:hypothetical protein [Siminovitchia terrae]RST58217.1 hypothetical protein D5F11_018260 [Siminovitchia terrae]GIN92042.1 hypothetical protein J22TS1_30930 [Siminovitchia terrae]GIN96521.1 hypothetical protein J6TS1_23910 [Siminovitchia terrae]